MVNIGNLNTNSERRGFSFIVFIAIIGFSLARGIANFYTNYLWFDSVGLESVWIKILLTRTVLVGATSLIAFIFIFTNLRLATRATPVMDIFEAFDSEDPLARFIRKVSARSVPVWPVNTYLQGRFGFSWEIFFSLKTRPNAIKWART